jgi:hypothetical protein
MYRFPSRYAHRFLPSLSYGVRDAVARLPCGLGFPLGMAQGLFARRPDVVGCFNGWGLLLGLPNSCRQ